LDRFPDAALLGVARDDALATRAALDQRGERPRVEAALGLGGAVAVTTVAAVFHDFLDVLVVDDHGHAWVACHGRVRWLGRRVRWLRSRIRRFRRRIGRLGLGLGHGRRRGLGFRSRGLGLSGLGCVARLGRGVFGFRRLALGDLGAGVLAVLG